MAGNHAIFSKISTSDHEADVTKKPIIAVIVTLDTKEIEGFFLRDRIITHGGKPLLIDVSMRKYTPKLGVPEICNEGVAKAANLSMEEVDSLDRSKAQLFMAKGVVKILKEMLERKELHGVIGIGGSTGLSLCIMIMRELPLFMPKYLVTTVISEAGRLISGSDITLMWSVSDFAGGDRVNEIEAEVLNRAAAAIVAAASPKKIEIEKRPVILASQFGNTTPHIIVAKDFLSMRGYDLITFHALGKIGGYVMERLIESGVAVGVLDVTLHELIDEVAGGVLIASFEDKFRLTAAGERGVPQVVLPGAVDMINFWGPETVPERFRDRGIYEHSKGLFTLVRASAEELYQVGRLIGERLSRSKGPTLFIFPLRGLSIIDNDPNAKPRSGAYCQKLRTVGGVLQFEVTNKPWHDPKANIQLLKGLLETLDTSKPNIDVVSVDYNINDPEVAELAAKTLDSMIKGAWRKGEYEKLLEMPREKLIINLNKLLKICE